MNRNDAFACDCNPLFMYACCNDIDFETVNESSNDINSSIDQNPDNPDNPDNSNQDSNDEINSPFSFSGSINYENLEDIENIFYLKNSLMYKFKNPFLFRGNIGYVFPELSVKDISGFIYGFGLDVDIYKNNRFSTNLNLNYDYFDISTININKFNKINIDINIVYSLIKSNIYTGYSIVNIDNQMNTYLKVGSNLYVTNKITLNLELNINNINNMDITALFKYNF